MTASLSAPVAPAFARLIEIMAQLRDPETGCEWDRAQSFETIAPYTIEEAYEVVDAIERGSMSDLREELGDLLLQVVFHARMAEEAGHFALDDVAASIVAKLEARHPHIFGTSQHQMGQREHWEAIKQRERKAKGAISAIDGVATALPALQRADKLQRRAAREGFDWPDPTGAAAKIVEEIAEVDAAADADRFEEAGDLLFAAVNFVRLHEIDPETALRAANAKFERRFRAMEQCAARTGKAFAELGLDQQELLWEAVKRSESEGL